MAAPAILRGQYMTLAVESDTPGSYTNLCGITTKSLTIQANTSDSFVRDCADPEDVPVRLLNITGKQWDLAGEGLYNRSQRELIDEAVGVIQNFRLIFTEPAGEDVEAGHYQGAAAITNVQFGGADGELGTLSIQLASDGAWAWTAAV